MKSGREHRAPLSGSAFAIIEQMQKFAAPRGFVFFGDRPGQPLSGMALKRVVRRMVLSS
jgi:hypothetical protein